MAAARPAAASILSILDRRYEWLCNLSYKNILKLIVMEELCLICNKSLANSETANVKKKGIETLKKSSLLREDGLELKIRGLEELVLHQSCRKRYTNESMVRAFLKRKARNAQKQSSVTSIFNQDAEEENLNEVPDQDPLQSDYEVTIKEEIEDDISEYEDDLTEQLENKRRREEAAFEANKKIKVEAVHSVQTESRPHASQSTEVLTSRPAKSGTKQSVEDVGPTEVFMAKVLSSQNEILRILKHQVLLQEPNPELLTFLRFLGMKMHRLSNEKRKELQDKITEMVLKEC